MSASTQDFDREHRLNEVVADYLRALQAGRAPSQEDVLAQHPDLAPELAEFFADRRLLEELAAPLRAAAADEPLPGFDMHLCQERQMRCGLIKYMALTCICVRSGKCVAG